MGSSASDSILSTMFKLGFAVVVVCLVIGIESMEDKFCPRGKLNGSPTQKECRATENKFKCGIFFQDLLGKGEIKWIGALPDAIRRVKKNPEKIGEIFPKYNGKPLETSNFNLDTCDGAVEKANRECYLLMSQKNKEPLSSRDATLGNLEGDDKIGNQLCAQAKRFLQKDGQSTENGLNRQIISFYSSTCNGPWQPVTSSTDGHLKVVEPLCCDKNWNHIEC